ncbi:MAG: outer membrane protein assembly factor BamA [Rhodothermia bacterium]|nr:outer membrane protein assembly factor BamA [Rhodothermia bacterium]
MLRIYSGLVLSLCALMNVVVAQTPQPEQKYRILGITVEGTNDENTRRVVSQSSGLAVGQEVTIPGDEKFSDAVRRLYRLGSFSDISIVAERIIDQGAFLIIRVKDEPLLGEYAITGVRKSQNDELRKKIDLLRGRPVKPSDVAVARQRIVDHFQAKGNKLVKVEVETKQGTDGRKNLTFKVERGPTLEVQQIEVVGNTSISSARIKRKMKDVKEDKWWRFFKKNTFNRDKFDEALGKVVAMYTERGFYAAHVVKDSVYVVYNEKGKPGLNVRYVLDEGPKYHIRKLDWNGNTVYTDDQLSAALGLQKGQPYNSKRLEQNLYMTKEGSDVSSLYMNRGYMQFRVMPEITQVPGDSLDLVFDLFEGDVFRFGQINIAGNSKTKDHVVRRELNTVPGSIFSRSDLIDSLNRLSQLKYFDQQKLYGADAIGQNIDPEKKTVDITYNLSEVSTDQLQFSGGWGGSTVGLILQLGVTFNNFSIQNTFNKKAWKPLPAGDGQQFAVSVQASGRSYQSGSISFTEPWFKGKPRPIGLSVSYNRYNLNALRYSSYYGLPVEEEETTDKREFSTISAQGSYGLRLAWPDPYFQTSSALAYRRYNVNFTGVTSYYGLPVGINQEVSFTQSLSRDTRFPAIFPREGSSAVLSVSVAPPISNFIQYHKWNFKSNYLIPITGGLSFSASADFSYVGSLNSKKPNFGLFQVGGGPMDSQYNYDFGTERVFLRGYPLSTITLFQSDGSRIGGSLLNKYTTELRLLAVRSQQFTLEPYVFFDAANVYDGFKAWSPSNLYRSLGVGGRIFLPILGMVEVSYGRNLDPFIDGTSMNKGSWRPQFTIGGSF